MKSCPNASRTLSAPLSRLLRVQSGRHDPHLLRGGSDITGSIVARAIHADLYENWTDVSGFLVTDPRIVENPVPIETITYKELRELAYMGASVLHEDAIFPVRREGIPINIRNTNKPEDPGTLIVENTCRKPKYTITGIAGKTGFCSVTIEKAMMNSEIGFGRKVLGVFEDCRYFLRAYAVRNRYDDHLRTPVRIRTA